MALYLVIRVGAFLSRIIPRSWRYLLGTAIGDLLYVVWGRGRRVTKDNIATILGTDAADPRVRRIALKSTRNYCKYLVEFLELPQLSSSDTMISSMTIEGVEYLQNALRNGKGVVLASAHFGTIEVGGLRLADFTDFYAVYDTFKPMYLDRLIQRKRREKGINLVSTKDIKQMLRVLRNGGTLTMLFDRPMEVTKGVPVRFFGRETAVPGGPAVLAMKTGATILPVYMLRKPDLSFTCMVFPPIEWVPSDDRERVVQTIMQRLMDTLQTVVREYPDQWYMFRPVWPEEPQGAPNPIRETAGDLGT